MSAADTADDGKETAKSRDADFSELSGEVQGGAAGSGDSPDTARFKALADENHDKYVRALAELENFKKRAIKERSDLLKYQGERILADFLEVLDNLELALQHAEAEPEKLKAGIEMIHKLFIDTLGRWDVRSDSAVGKEFDPNRYEALSKVRVDDAKPGTIINEFKKAYMYKDKLLRPGSVVVAAEPETPDEGQGEPE